MSTPFYTEVTAVNRLSPHFVRVSFGGAAMMGFAHAGYDHWFRLFLPRPGEDKPSLPQFDDDAGLRTWYNSTPESERPIIRNYTVRRFCRDTQRLDVDFVVHGDTGPASIWAQGVAVGDIVGIYDQGAMFQPLPDTQRYLLIGDETGLPAIAGTLESLADGPVSHTFLEIPLAGDRQEVRSSPGSTVQWHFREEAPAAGESSLVELVRAAELPVGDRIQALVVGESSMVRAVRRHLVDDRGIGKDRITFCGYWRKDLATSEAAQD